MKFAGSPKWYVIDATDVILGRVASQIAIRLMGKDKPNYNTYSMCGSGIIVINAAKLRVTGNKLSERFFWHTGYAGGVKSLTLQQRLLSNPSNVLIKTVQRMLGKGPLGREQLKRLRVYVDSHYPHIAQKPEVWHLADNHVMNKKY
jgi:large subunit ribosomal protein L13